MGDPSERLGSGNLDSISTVKTDDFSMEIDPPFQENAVTAEDWRKSLSKVVPTVVVLRITATRTFDAESVSASYFVIDKRCGIILTDHHVVKPGPVVAEAMFLNREEVPVHRIYKDLVLVGNGQDMATDGMVQNNGYDISVAALIFYLDGKFIKLHTW